jgi:putative heme-binding domain-containing protein
MSAPPPRNDIAQPVTWDLSAHAGKSGVLEIVDGDTGGAYAWLAVGRFEPAVVPMPLANPSQPNQRPLFAAELARTVPLPELAERFAALFQDTNNRNEIRAAAAQTLVALDAPGYVPLTAGTLADTNQPAAFRESLALLLAEQTSPVARAAVLDALRAAPQRLQIRLALLLAVGAAGADALLTLVEQKKLSPQVIADRAVKERLTAAKLPRFNERYEPLTRGITPVSVELQKMIDERRAGFAAAVTSVDRGRAVFEKACAVCHQRDGQGAVVGPQLDGLGTRGLERIVEDVLDPNRNADPAFTPSLITLKDDTSITGLLRREEGEMLVFVDTLGKEVAVPKNEITERRESQLSLMPANFGEVLTVAEFHDLMAFLLE